MVFFISSNKWSVTSYNLSPGLMISIAEANVSMRWVRQQLAYVHVCDSWHASSICWGMQCLRRMTALLDVSWQEAADAVCILVPREQSLKLMGGKALYLASCTMGSASQMRHVCMEMSEKLVEQ